ncbi:MAG: TetR/AcrR family transcriptional regulator [bacterium]
MIKDEKHNVILTAARKLFGRYGLRKTTVDEIAREARVGKGTIYNYYTSKEEVFQAVVEEEAQIFKNEIKKAVDSQATPEKKIRAYVITRMQIINQLANFYSSFKDEYLEYYGFIEKIRKKYTNYEISTIKDILKEGINKKVFSIKDLDLTTFAVVIAMKGLEYYWAIEQGPLETEKKIDTLLKIFFNGILRR